MNLSRIFYRNQSNKHSVRSFSTNNKTKSVNFNTNNTAQPQKTKIVRFDWAIKTLLRDKVNFEILEGFLSELLKEPITIDKMLESESNKKNEATKFNRVDLLANTTNNEKVIIEVQTATEWDFLHRVLFGTSKIVTEYIDEGSTYATIPRVISVNILFFNFSDNKDYVHKGTTEFVGLHDNQKMKLREDINFNQSYNNPSEIFPLYYIIQLPHFNDKVGDGLDEWIYMLKNEEIKPEFKAQGIEEAQNKLDVMKLSVEQKREHERFKEDLMLERSVISSAKEEGIAEGVEKGKKEGKKEAKIETIQSMHQSGISEEIIAKVFKTDVGEISEILKKNYTIKE